MIDFKSEGPLNPFEITKASDCTDFEIINYWVDLTREENRLVEMLDPRSPHPVLLIGGKGSGKTHLMRYLSLPIQAMRHEGSARRAVSAERYVGIYFRCGGLDSLRFQGKGLEQDVWNTIFTYYVDLWVAQLTVQAVLDCCEDDATFSVSEPAAVNAVYEIFNDWPAHIARPTTFSALKLSLRLLQKDIDLTVNNLAFRRDRPDFKVLTNPGQLIFAVANIVSECFPLFDGVQFLFLMDELENFTVEQQKYAQTLIRERQSPCSFRIGARRYGVRTYETLAAGEVNRPGSEFAEICLDDKLREDEDTYRNFALRVCAQRLKLAYALRNDGSELVEELLATRTTARQWDAASIAKECFSGVPWSDRPHIKKLRSNLEQVGGGGNALELLAVVDEPLLEKLNILLFYRAISEGRPLEASAAEIAAKCSQFREGPRRESASDYGQTLAHYSRDLLAQLVRENRKKDFPLYLGFDDFVTMSEGILRNLLILLKLIFKWAAFSGELSGERRPISSISQTRGVREAAEWFLSDARGASIMESHVKGSVERLALLLASLRFSEKPSEVSLITFSFPDESISDEALEVIDLCEKWSLLIRVGDRRDRNSLKKEPRYQINRLLAPRWDLPIARRGSLSLKASEIESIFNPKETYRYQDMLKERLKFVEFPFGKRGLSQLQLEFE